MIKYLSITDFKQTVKMLINDEFTSDTDKEWWEGVLYGLQLAGKISVEQKEHLVELLGFLQDENVEEMNNGGEE